MEHEDNLSRLLESAVPRGDDHGQQQHEVGLPFVASLPHTEISYLTQHKNVDGVVSNHLLVSAGEDTWASWEFMHGDYFAANRLNLNAEFPTIA